MSIVLVAAFTMEVCARIDDWFAYGAGLFSSHSINNLYYRDELGRWGKPNARFEKWRLNDIGLRGPDLSPGSSRVAVLGSSETFGLYESEDNEYPRLLELRLREACRERVDVASVAFPGLHPQTVLRRLDWIAKQVRPVAAVIYLPPANYADVEVIREPSAVDGGSGQGSPLRWLLGAVRSLRMVARTQALVKRHAPPELLNSYRVWSIQRATARSEVLEDVPERHLKRMRQDLEELVRGLESRGVAVVLATHASRFAEPLTDDDRYWLTAWRVFYPGVSEAGILRLERRGNELIRSVAQSEGVRLVDVAAKLDGHVDYFADFTHFTDAGAEAMAKTLAPALNVELPQSAQCR